MRRVPVVIAGAVALIALVMITLTGTGSSPVLYATFQSATNLVDGNYVTVDGVNVGSVSGIAIDHGVARVALSIDNRRVWPLHQGTTAEIRFGGTVSYSDRYVELIPGPDRAPVLRSGASLALADTVTPVEFDQLFDTFTPSARTSLGALVDNGAATFEGRAQGLAAGVAAAPPALDQTSQLLTDLNADPNALRTLIASGANVARSLADTQPQLLGLVASTSTTLSAVARNASATEATLQRLPGTLTTARHTLTSLDPTLIRLRALVGDLRPGTVGLRALATPLADAVNRLAIVAPQLNATLATVQTSAPRVTDLLKDATPLARQLKPALGQLSPILGCVRAYSPELAGFMATWHSLAIFHDAQGVYGRVEAQEFPFTNGTTANSAQLVKSTQGLLYSLIRPPGFNAGQTWLQPQCGAGTAGLDPSDDPEAARP